MYQNKGEGYGMHVVFENIIYIISGITYVILTILVLKKHRKNIENKFSYLGKLNLTWLRYLIIGLCVIWLSFIVGDEYTFSTVVIYVFFIGYYGIQAGIFTQPQVIHAASKADFERVNKMASEAIRDDERIVQIHSVEIFEEENDSMTVKYKKSGLSDESANEIHKRLCALMAEKKLFKNPELSLTELALELNVNPNVLSQIINSIEQKNFYDYINELRVLEFKKFITLSENQKFTLLALAYECGFNSKTSFNRNFKKLTGISPTEYLAQMNTNLSNK